MPLDPKEAIDLADEAYHLGQVIASALKKDPDGKIRLTKRERRQIGRAALKLVIRFGVDLLD